MRTELEAPASRTPILRRVLASVVLIGVAALVVTTLVHVVMAVFWTLVGVVAIVAVLWALKTLFW
ncbi:MAG TPA: hypothetical protein VKR21_05480 [Solirubrobacteraceae bacterium]|nr:hypothetical protein [Solirubrobacteraceae bacterium]